MMQQVGSNPSEHAASERGRSVWQQSRRCAAVEGAGGGGSGSPGCVEEPVIRNE